MIEFDETRYKQIEAAVKSRPVDELVAELHASEGIDSTLQMLFAGMVSAFNPTKAAGQQAMIQYDIKGPDGTHSYRMHIADGTCTVEPGITGDPKAAVRISMGDFLRLIIGTLNPMQALMTGKLKVQGDLFFLQSMQNWFDRT